MPRADTINAFRRMAVGGLGVIDRLARADLGPDDLLIAALREFSGQRLEDFRKTVLRLNDASTFETTRIAPLRRTYDLNDLTRPRDHAPGRVLVLHASEYRFVPLAEGVLSALEMGTISARSDVRTAVHTVARWATEREPACARLVCSVLTIAGASRSWRPIAAFYEHVLRPHRRDDALAAADAREFGRLTTQVLHEELARGTTHGVIVRRLMTNAEQLGILPPRPRFEPDQQKRRLTELAQVLLDIELGLELDAPARRLLNLLTDATLAGA